MDLIVDLLGVWTPTPGTIPPDDSGVITMPDSGVDVAMQEDGAVVLDAEVGADVREAGGPRNDAGTDGSTDPGSTGGCGCRTAKPRSAFAFTSGWIVIAAMLAARRRRRIVAH